MSTDSKIVNNHACVDLGLPSGVLWATCNVGANSPTECGSYFSWGETETKDNYVESTSKWEAKDQEMLKYVCDPQFGKVDHLYTLLPADDATSAAWGDGWSTPYIDDIEELLDACKHKWTDNYENSGVAGMVFTSKANGNSIFLPAAGYTERSEAIDVNTFGSYWTASLLLHNCYSAYTLDFNKKICTDSELCRYYGLCIRPILPKEKIKK